MVAAAVACGLASCSGDPSPGETAAPSSPATVESVSVDGELFARTTADGTPLRVTAKGRLPGCAVVTVFLGSPPTQSIDVVDRPAAGDLDVMAADQDHVTVQVGARVRAVVWRDASGDEIDRMVPVKGTAVLGRTVETAPPPSGAPPPPPRGGTDLGAIQVFDGEGRQLAESAARRGLSTRGCS